MGVLNITSYDAQFVYWLSLEITTITKAVKLFCPHLNCFLVIRKSNNQARKTNTKQKIGGVTIYSFSSPNAWQFPSMHSKIRLTLPGGGSGGGELKLKQGRWTPAARIWRNISGIRRLQVYWRCKPEGRNPGDAASGTWEAAPAAEGSGALLWREAARAWRCLCTGGSGGAAAAAGGGWRVGGWRSGGVLVAQCACAGAPGFLTFWGRSWGLRWWRLWGCRRSQASG